MEGDAALGGGSSFSSGSDSKVGGAVGGDAGCTLSRRSEGVGGAAFGPGVILRSGVLDVDGAGNGRAAGGVVGVLRMGAGGVARLFVRGACFEFEAGTLSVGTFFDDCRGACG